MPRSRSASGRNFLYEPDSDFSIGQYLLAHAAGGSPVRGAAQVNPGDQVGDLRRGEIVEMSANPGSPAWASTLDSLGRRLARGGLSGRDRLRAGQLRRRLAR